MTANQHPHIAFTPPLGYQEVDSALEGVTIFAPQPIPSGVDAAKTFTCPKCGASLAYDVSASGIACQHCGYQEKVQTQQVGQRAEEFEFTLETLGKTEQGWGELRAEVHCENCGAELSYPQGAMATSCPYCASNKVNVQIAEDDKLRPRFLVPFKLHANQIPTLVTNWLGRGWFHPPELSANTIIRRFKGYYLPYWTFDANIHANWRAEVGQQVTQRVYNASEKRWETRTHIIWRWREGQVTVPIDDLLVIGVSNQHLSHRILKNLEPFNLGSLVAYQPDYLAGLQAQAYDITLPEAWETGKQSMRQAAKKACESQVNSSYVRNFSMSADFADESWRYILLPVYLAAYKYEGKVFQVMVNAQTGSVAGQKPVAWWKVWLAIAACLLPGLLTGLMGLPLLLLGGAGVILIILGAILLIPGIIGSVIIYRKAQESEAG